MNLASFLLAAAGPTPDSPALRGPTAMTYRELAECVARHARGLAGDVAPGDRVAILAGGEGTFLLCTFWLAQALALAGQLDRARAVFERAIAFVNDVGLLAEEVDTVSGELLGNFPQAFSHVGLINSALNSNRQMGPAEGRAESETPPIAFSPAAT